jgi:lysophospholipase L1-like esterase
VGAVVPTGESTIACASRPWYGFSAVRPTSQSLAKETYVKSTRFSSWLLVGLLASAVGCGTSSGGSPGQAGGTPSGGVPAGGGKPGSGGVTGSGGATGGQNAGGNVGRGGANGTGGGGNSSGGQGAGGSAGSSATGGAVAGSGGSAGAQTGGSSAAGGAVMGGAPATGGQGSGGKNTGGSSGNGGNAAGGSSGSGGNAAGGASSMGGSTTGTGGSSSAYHPCPTDGTACKIMPFGDSITDGYNPDTPGGYRVELFRRAHADGKNITFVGSGSNGPSTVDGVAFPPRHEGHSGWTIYPEGGRDGISYCLQANQNHKCLATNSVMLEYTPHVVLLMIGTNDAIDNYDMANAPTRLGTLIDTIYEQLPNVLIVVAQPIPSRGDASKGDDTGLSARIKTYDDAIPAVVKARADKGKHISIVDMYTPFNANKASLIEDQWHPNLAGYVLLGTQWYSVLKPQL